MYRFLALAVSVVLIASACGDESASVATDDGDTDTRPSLAGDWILQALTVGGTAVTLPEGELEISIELGQMSGNLGCNSFFGEIDAADEGTLVVAGLGQTEMACEDRSRMDFEVTYGQALGSATNWTVDPTGLTLSGPAAEIRYRQAPPPVHQSLEATEWHFDTIYSGEGPDGAATNRGDMSGVTLVIEDGLASISNSAHSDNCTGTVDATYTGDREGSFSAANPSDLDDPPGCDIVEIARGGLLESTAFMIDENRLTFIGDAGETVGFSTRP